MNCEGEKMGKTCPDLHAIANHMGVRLVRHASGPKAFYIHRRRVISTRRGMSITQYRSSLAHELGHAHYGDEPTLGVFDTKQEKRADLWAANLLIDSDEFRQAYIWHRGRLGGIADELEVSHHLLRVWAGQWWEVAA